MTGGRAAERSLGRLLVLTAVAFLVAAYAPLSAAAYASQYPVFTWLLARDLSATAP